jgi:CubicO group peptidase (beta-lactamase class C family)
MSRHSLVRTVPLAIGMTCMFVACALNPAHPIIDAARVDELGQRFVHEPPARGLSVGIVKDGVSRIFNYGEYDRDRHRPPEAATLYSIGSLTKTFTATLLAQAVIEGRVNLEDDVRRHLDGDYPNLEFDGQPIRLVHLLNHNSGLPAMLPQDLAGDPSPEPQVERERVAAERLILQGYTGSEFRRDLRSFALDAVPGTRLRYSNAAAEVLRLVLERVYGKSFAELVREKITDPLGMRETWISSPAAEVDALVGYDGAGVAVKHNADFMPAAGGITSSVRDMLKYARWHLEERGAAVRLTHQPAWRIDDTFSIGLNWQMFTLPDYRVVWQEGGLPGFTSYCVVYPELGLAIVAFTNELDPQTSSELGALVKELTRRIDPRATNLP